MRVAVLLSLVGLALSAPVLEENEEKTIVKRSEEQIGFGNQQNGPEVQKKRDPSILEDKLGSVVAESPEAIVPEAQDENQEQVSSDNNEARVEEELNAIIKEGQMAQQVAAEEAGETVPNVEQEQETSNEEASDSNTESSEQAENNENKQEVVVPEETVPVIEEPEQKGEEAVLNNEVSPEDNEAIKELMEENMVSSEPDDSDTPEQFESSVDTPEEDALQENNNEQSLQMLEENPFEAYRMFKTYQNVLSHYPTYFPDAYGEYLNGRRRRASSTLLSRLRSREMKRNHRIKRELPYGDSSLFPYFYPEREQDDEDALYRVIPDQEILDNDPYELYPEEALEEELAAEEGLPYAEEDEEEYGTPVMYGGKMGYFTPSKRQDMLSFVPGNKREAFFYPFSKEPDTHYQAFVPEKRSYLESYGDLVRLARALALEPQDREQYLQGYEWE